MVLFQLLNKIVYNSIYKLLQGYYTKITLQLKSWFIKIHCFYKYLFILEQIAYKKIENNVFIIIVYYRNEPKLSKYIIF